MRQSLISGAESNKWAEVFTGMSEDKVLSLAAGFDNVLFVCGCVVLFGGWECYAFQTGNQTS